jgi:hypothetical protein
VFQHLVIVARSKQRLDLGLAISRLLWRSVRVRLGLRFSLGIRDRLFRQKGNQDPAPRRAVVVGVDVLSCLDKCPVRHAPGNLGAFPLGPVRVLKGSCV